jgi:DNA-binding SARP family transcriptional activator/tetratricopeptide (TPR) repeat protein
VVAPRKAPDRWRCAPHKEIIGTMWFGLLGPLQVRIEDRELPVPAPRQRILLAALLLTPGLAVSTERLSELVWDGLPPAGSAVTLRSYVKRLRQVLGPAGRARIVTAGRGYLIEAAAEELDLAQYVALCRRGEAAVQSSAWQRAADLLGRAESLWRGDPLADIACQELQTTEVPRLEQLRLQAIQWRIDADLRLGQCNKVVPELYALATEHPLREPFHHQLMVALYRSGRPADALAAYRKARDVLVREVGIEPGADLRLLHQRILADDHDLLTVPRPGPPAPAQLPPDTPHFAGRAAEVRELTCLAGGRPAAGGGTAIAVISGMAGVGKTALAVHWAHQVAGLFPDGQIYLNLNGFGPAGLPVTPSDAVRQILEALQVPLARIPSSLEGQVGLYRTLVFERRVLVALDNAKDADQVRPLLPGGAGCMAVITSRSPLASLVALEGARPLTLRVLSEPEARLMVAERLGSRQTGADLAATDQLIGACARLPLALAIATALIATRPGQSISTVAGNVARAGSRLDALATGDTTTSLRAVFSWSYQALTPAAARMFRLLAAHPGPDISAAAAASVAGLRPAQAREALDELSGAHLVSEHAPGRFAVHDLLRVYAAEQSEGVDGRAERRAAGQRMLDHYLLTAKAAAHALSPTRELPSLEPTAPYVQPEDLSDEDQGTGWLRAEHRVLMRAISYAADEGFDGHAWQLPWVLTDFLSRDGHWHDWEASQRIALAAALRVDDVAAQAQAHRYIGRACFQLQDLDAAQDHLSHALELQRQLGKPVAQASASIDLCQVYERRGDLADALKSAQLAVSVYQSEHYHLGEALALNNVGWYHALLGNYPEALRWCRQALELCIQVGYTIGEGHSWDSLGFAHQHLGQSAHAITCYGRALDIYRQLSDRYDEARVLSRIGDISRVAGDFPGARRAWQAALDILDDLGHPDGDELRVRISSASHH